jgi:glycolate oxidase FAD binding subunit
VDLIHPHTPADVAETLREASARGTRLLVVGGRRHMDKGNPCEVDAELWTTMLGEVVAYEPAEMLVVIEAGTRCADLGQLLAEHGQEWPVDAPRDATVGGVIAAGVSSARRLRVGHVRDTVVEMQLATGDGRLITSGARTVKNVTGYDVHRLATGSLGTLGVITRVALKVRPLPERSVVLASEGDLELAEAVLDTVPRAARVEAWPTRIEVALEGWADEVAQMETAAREVADLRPIEAIEAPEPSAPTVLEAAVPPSRLGALVEGLQDWRALAGVGLARIGCASAEEVAEVRTHAQALGGVAPAVRGPGGLGDAPVPAREVHRRLKAAFDPAGILAPGRAWHEG